MNTIEDIISYIKEIDSTMSPKKLRYILYLMYADYLIINNQLGDESYKKLFNSLFKVDKNGPMPLHYNVNYTMPKVILLKSIMIIKNLLSIQLIVIVAMTVNF